MENEFNGNFDELTPVQQRNLLAFRIRKLLTKQAYGNKVVIATPESEVLDETHPMALPLSSINSRKQVVMRFAGETEYPDGSKERDYEAEDQPLSDTTEDIIVAMKRTLDQLEAAIGGKKKAKRKPVIEEVQEEEPVAEIKPTPNSLGTVIENEAKKEVKKTKKTETKVDRQTKIKDFISCLLED